MPAHIPAPLAAMLQQLGVAVPPSGMFKRRVLNDTMLRKNVTPGRREHVLRQLTQAGLLVDDRKD